MDDGKGEGEWEESELGSVREMEEGSAWEGRWRRRWRRWGGVQ